MAIKQKLTPCLWFNDQGEDAARFYIGVFPNSRINAITRYSTAGHEIHGRPAGSVMTVEFELDGHTFTALNGGPHFTFSEAVSFQIEVEDQAEIDYYWDKLTADGGSESQCGWLKDKFGLSWQVVPKGMAELFGDQDGERVNRAWQAMMQMTKIDIEELRRAADGATA